MPTLNQIPRIDINQSKTRCCALIDPEDWNDLTIIFDDQLFVKSKVHSFMHIPLDMSSVMTKTQKDIDVTQDDTEGFLVLSYEATPWHSEHYFAVDRVVPGHEMVSISGEFLTKVFEGPYKDAQKWHRQLREFAKSKGRQPLKTYFFYTTCPKCSKAYGKNYVVGFVQVA
jgi:hypothetical protein